MFMLCLCLCLYIYSIYLYIYNVWLPVRLFEESRISTSLNHTSSYAWYIRHFVVDIKVFKICRPHCNVAALRGTDSGSCHFHCTVLTALCGAGVCLCLFLLLNVVYLPIYAKLRLVVGMTKQMSNSKEVDSELLTLENHVDLHSFGRHDISRVNNSHCLPPYHLTFV